nr:carboxypeptidase-like regulatory domain-containing protein [uncultured Tolumonas sp.]
MSYSFSDTFTNSDALGYGTLVGASLTHNSTAKAVDMIAPNGSGGWWGFTGLATADRGYLLTFEADLELISDPSSRKHLGIFLTTSSNMPTGIRFAHLDGYWQLARFATISSGTEIVYSAQANPTFNIGERRRIKVVKNLDNYKFYVDDVLVCDFTDATYRLCIPGVFDWYGNIRVHSVSYQVDGMTISALTLPIILQIANKETRSQAWPGENSCKQLDSQTAEKAYGVTTSAMLNAPPLRKDVGFIEGVITRKTAPAVGQHVICLNDRFNLVAETLSGAGGYYRFDSLPINGLYAIHAYDNNEYKYAPAGADRRTPETYP